MNSDSISNNSKTDWTRLEAMSDEDIDLSDCPEVTPQMFEKAVVRRSHNTAAGSSPRQMSSPAPIPEATVTLAVEQDVLEWFQSQGDSAERQMALALKIYAEANKAYLLE